MPNLTDTQLKERLSDSKIKLMDNQPDREDKYKIITFQITPKRSWKVKKEEGTGYDYFTTVYHLLMDTFDFGKRTESVNGVNTDIQNELHDHHFFDLIYYIEPESNFMNQVNLDKNTNQFSNQFTNQFSGPISIIGRNYQEN